MQCTSSLLIPCAHGKLNVKHHRTTPKPEMHIYHSRESRSCAGEKVEHQKRIQAAQQQECGYVCIQARLISTNPGSMEEARECGLPRGTCFVARHLELVAVAGRLWISWVCFGWGGFFPFFFFRFYLVVVRISSNAHGLLQVRAVPCLMYLSTSKGSLF